MSAHKRRWRGCHHRKFLNFARRPQYLRYHFLRVEIRWIFFPSNKPGEKFLPVDLMFIHCCFWTAGINWYPGETKTKFLLLWFGWLVSWFCFLLFHLYSLHQTLLGFFHDLCPHYPLGSENKILPRLLAKVVRGRAIRLCWPVGLVLKGKFVRNLASDFPKPWTNCTHSCEWHKRSRCLRGGQEPLRRSQMRSGKDSRFFILLTHKARRI